MNSSDGLKGRFVARIERGDFAPSVCEDLTALIDRITQLEAEVERLNEELKLWLVLVNEGGVPRYTITPGAALNTVVTSTKRLVALHGDRG